MVDAGAASAVGLRKSYVPVPLDIFSPGRELEFSLYGRQANKAIVPVCRAGQVLSEDSLQGWRRLGAQVLYVDTAEHRLYQKYANLAYDSILERDDLPVQRKFDLSYRTTVELIRGAVESSTVEEVAGERREKWVDKVVSLICDDAAAVEGMVSMLSHDYYTYTHMVNVSVMVALLAHRLGERDRERLGIITGGGLLHDVGKLRINPDTLNKMGTLTQEEWAELKLHPSLGLDFLHGRPDVRPVELLMVHQHHEKLDGSGYPLGLLGAEISAEAQMTAVIDTYDALTCKRPYRPAMTHDKAMSILVQEAQSKINRDMVRLWREIMERVMVQERQLV